MRRSVLALFAVVLLAVLPARAEDDPLRAPPFDPLASLKVGDWVESIERMPMAGLSTSTTTVTAVTSDEVCYTVETRDGDAVRVRCETARRTAVTLAAPGAKKGGTLALSEVALETQFGKTVACTLCTLVEETGGTPPTLESRTWWSKEVPFGRARVEISKEGQPLFEVVAWGTGGPPSAQASSPRACLEALKAHAAADSPGMYSYLVDPHRAARRRVAAFAGGVRAVQARLKAAVEARFGADAGGFVVPVERAPGSGTLEIVEVKQTGERATAKVRQGGREETLQLQKVEDYWFVAPTEPAPGDEWLQAQLAPRKAAMKELDSLVKDLAAGRLASAGDVQARYRQAMSTLEQGLRAQPPAAGGGGGRRPRR